MICLAYFALLAARGSSKSTSPLVDYVHRIMRERQIPGLSVAIMKQDRVVWSSGFGYANLETGTPATSHTVYGLLSLGKQFTATAVLKLVASGKLALKEPVTLKLPFIPQAWKAVTVQNLLSHTSGIPDYTSAPSYWRQVRLDAAPTDLLKPVLGQPLAFQPGTQFRYSNSNYFLLGLLIENVSRMPWAEYVRKEVIAPLNLAETYAAEPGDLLKNRASGYHLAGGKMKNAEPISPTQTWAAGAVYSSVNDLTRFEVAKIHHQLLPDSYAEQMNTPFTLNNGSKAPYGFASEVGANMGHRVSGHQGGGLAYNASLLEYPDDGVTVIVLTNLTQGRSADIARHIATFYIPGLSAPKTKTKDPDPDRTSRFKRVLSEIAAGTLHDADFTAEAVAEMVPALKHQGPRLLSSFGHLKGLQFLDARSMPGGTLVRYFASFENGALVFSFTLSPNSQISDVDYGEPD